VTRLDAICLNRAASVGGVLVASQSDEEYEAAFRGAGLGQVNDPPEVVAARVKASDIRDALVAALDDWYTCTGDPPRQGWLLEVARQADRAPTGWRGRARDLETWKIKAIRDEVVATAPVADQSVP